MTKTDDSDSSVAFVFGGIRVVVVVGDIVVVVPGESPGDVLEITVVTSGSVVVWL